MTQYYATVEKKVGINDIVFTDLVETMTMNKKPYLHFKKINKYFDNSNGEIKEDEMRIYKRTKLGFLKSNKLGFTIRLEGNKLIYKPLNHNRTLEPIDHDLYNFMKEQFSLNRQLTTKEDKFEKLAPIIGLGIAALCFILALILFPKHVESIADKLIGLGRGAAQEILTKKSGVQIIPPA